MKPRGGRETSPKVSCAKMQNKMEESKNQHGGRRPGSGRKAMDKGDKKVTISFSIAPEMKERLQATAEEKNISTSSLLAEILDSYLPK